MATWATVFVAPLEKLATTSPLSSTLTPVSVPAGPPSTVEELVTEALSYWVTEAGLPDRFTSTDWAGRPREEAQATPVVAVDAPILIPDVAKVVAAALSV